MNPRDDARDVIVVTGAQGFLGSRVVALLRSGAPRSRVIAVSRHEEDERRQMPGVERLAGDLRHAEVWRSVPPTVTHVIHLAAVIPWNPTDSDQPRVVFDNLAPIAHLVHQSANWARLRQVVYGSSVSVYAPSQKRLRESSPAKPVTVYGAAKLAGETLIDILTSRGVVVASLRFSSLYGKGQYQGTVLPLFAQRAGRGLPLELFNGRRVQDFVHVDDAARATWLAYKRAARGPFNIGTGRSVSMAMLARSILRAFDPERKSRIVTSTTAASDDNQGIRLDIGRARREMGYQPQIHLSEGLRQLARDLEACVA